MTIPVSGTYTDNGATDIDVGGVLYEDAWHISATYTMELTSTGVFTRDYPAQADFYYVDGIGLVKEFHTDIETDSVILSKVLDEIVWEPGTEPDPDPDPDPEPEEDTGTMDADTGTMDADTGTTGTVDPDSVPTEPEP